MSLRIEMRWIVSLAAVGDRERVIFFFFQAEDGIRDLTVTGVQTCALPISDGFLPPAGGTRHRAGRVASIPAGGVMVDRTTPEFRSRSEERRVGKECRSRWSPYH